MFVKRSVHSNGKIYISIVQGYRDENNKVKHKTIKSYGYLDDLKKKYKDFDTYINNELENLISNNNKTLIIKNINKKTKFNHPNEEKNFGYIILKIIYNKLGIVEYLKNKQKNLQLTYNLPKLAFYLVLQEVLFSNSNISTYQYFFIERFVFKEEEVNNAVNILRRYSNNLQKYIWDKSKDFMSRDTSTCYLYYLKIQENKCMVLLLDKNDIPIFYETCQITEQYKKAIKKIYNIEDLSFKKITDKTFKMNIISYVSITILQIIKNFLNNKYENKEIIKAIKESMVIKLEKDVYFQKQPSNIMKELTKICNIPYIRYQELANIKKLLKINSRFNNIK